MNHLCTILKLTYLCLLFIGPSSSANTTLGQLTIDSSGHNATLTTASGYPLQLNLGLSIPSNVLKFSYIGKSLQVLYEDKSILKIELVDTKHDVDVYKFKWSNPQNYSYLRDDIILDDSVFWYGGMQRLQQAWPMNVKDEITMMPYVIDDLWITEASGQERYWLCSKKIAIFVPDWVPLWHAIQNNSLTLQSQVVNTNENLQAQINSPYLSFPPASLLDFLEYEIWVVKDDRQSFSSFYQTTAKNLLKTPLGTIDPLLIEKPIWTTWARYFRTINESYLLEFADEIVSNGFPIAQLELDDSWTTHYGDYQVNTEKFPNFTGMIDSLRQNNIRLTAWVNPFVRNDSVNFANQSLHDYFIKTENGTPGFVWWWDGPHINSYAIDVTNPTAFDWFSGQLQSVKDMGVYAFKYDAGETRYLPTNFRLFAGTEPNDYSRAYVRFASSFGGAVEARVGSRTQELPILIRTLDRASDWYEYGLQTLIPNTLNFGLHGYFWNLPDIIGGNGVNTTTDKDLYIRWVQTTTFLMTMQFSVTPWDFDDETVEISKKMLAIRANWTDFLKEEAQKAVLTGIPMYRPLWWELETQEALNCSDQFFVGDRLLVAPMVYENAISRQVILPSGTWKDQNGAVIQGLQTVEVQAPLDVLPYFERISNLNEPSSTSSPSSTITLPNPSSTSSPNGTITPPNPSSTTNPNGTITQSNPSNTTNPSNMQILLVPRIELCLFVVLFSYFLVV